MSFSSFQDLFNQAANRLQISRQLQASQIVAYANNYIRDHIPNYQDIQIRSFKHGTLHCSVNHPIVAQKLNSHKLKLIQNINEKAGKNLLQKISILQSQQ